MKFKAMPFYMGKEYIIEALQDETGDIQRFIGEWNGFAFCTYENENGADMLHDRTIIGYICISGEGAK